MTPPSEWVARAHGSCEDSLGEKRRHDPVRGVDDLADLEIDGDAAEDVGLFAAEAALFDQVVDHVADGLLGAGEEIGTVGGRYVARPALDGRGDRPAGPEPWLRESAPGFEPEAERHLRHH